MSQGNVVVTGASTGIGRACALYLDRKGWRVFAGVRKEEDGRALAGRASERLHPLMLDVTDDVAVAKAGETVREAAGEDGLQGLVNNAGLAIGGPLEFLPLEDIRDQFEVNLFGQVAVTQAMLPMIRQGQGRIVNMSSVSGRAAAPLLGPYAGSKFALEAMSDALRVELQPWDIAVIVVEPGAIKTPIWNRGIARAEQIRERLPEAAEHFYGEAMDRLIQAARESDERGIPPAKVARAVYRALSAKRPKTRYVIGRDARITTLAGWLLPDRALDRVKTRKVGLPGPGEGLQ